MAFVGWYPACFSSSHVRADLWGICTSLGDLGHAHLVGWYSQATRHPRSRPRLQLQVDAEQAEWMPSRQYVPERPLLQLRPKPKLLCTHALNQQAVPHGARRPPHQDLLPGRHRDRWPRSPHRERAQPCGARMRRGSGGCRRLRARSTPVLQRQKWPTAWIDTHTSIDTPQKGADETDSELVD